MKEDGRSRDSWHFKNTQGKKKKMGKMYTLKNLLKIQASQERRLKVKRWDTYGKKKKEKNS